MDNHGFWLRFKKGNAVETHFYSAPNSYQAHQKRKQILSTTNGILAVSPIVKAGETTLPLQFKIIIKGESKDGR